MFVANVDYDSVVAFLIGYDAALSNCHLLGFHEWLVLEVSYGSNLSWSEVVLKIAFPESDIPRQQLCDSRTHQHAIKSLSECLGRFYEAKIRFRGIQKIIIEYREWEEKMGKSLDID